ncbi:MAG: hypothetical protein V1736_03940 [Pseudomonadota bacterium]
MTNYPPIFWRWKWEEKWVKGVVQQEMAELIKISGFWCMKADIDIRGYEEQVK